MLKPCGVIKPCSPRGPIYSGRLRARAVELYLEGVKLGYIGWAELQSSLEKEFPDEFQNKGQDKPSPETILEWVRRWPDAQQHLRDLRVQQVEPSSWQSRGMSNAGTYQFVPDMPVSPFASANPWFSALFQQCVAVMVFALMAHFVMALNWDQ